MPPHPMKRQTQSVSGKEKKRFIVFDLLSGGGFDLAARWRLTLGAGCDFPGGWGNVWGRKVVRRRLFLRGKMYFEIKPLHRPIYNILEVGFNTRALNHIIFSA